MKLDRSISATIAYADFFKFPLYPKEVHHWLIGSKTVSISKVLARISKMSSANIQLRKKTDSYTKEKITHTRRLIQCLKLVPGLRMIALTGSVAAGNTQRGDDIDLFFITSPDVLWIVRPLVIAIISLLFRRRYPGEDPAHARDAFCPNLWLDTKSLTIERSKRSLYTAHEVLQIIPLLDKKDTYQSFIKSNSWTQKYLANAYKASFRPKWRGLHPSNSIVILANAGIHQVSSFLSLLLIPLNFLFFTFQFLYMLPKKTTETVTLHTAFLHTTDYSAKLSHIIT